MSKKKINILILLKSKYHEILLSKEIRTRVNDCHVMSVQSVSDAKKLIEIETIESLIIEVNADIVSECCGIHQLHNLRPKMQIIAVVANYSLCTCKEMTD